MHVCPTKNLLGVGCISIYMNRGVISVPVNYNVSQTMVLQANGDCSAALSNPTRITAESF